MNDYLNGWLFRERKSDEYKEVFKFLLIAFLEDEKMLETIRTTDARVLKNAFDNVLLTCRNDREINVLLSRLKEEKEKEYFFKKEQEER